jgi:hypothetical protein
MRPTPVGAHASIGSDEEAGQADATPAEAERRGGPALAKDDLVAEHHELTARMGTSASPSCGTFVPSATSLRDALWLSPGGLSLLVPTGN